MPLSWRLLQVISLRRGPSSSGVPRTALVGRWTIVPRRWLPLSVCFLKTVGRPSFLSLEGVRSVNECS